MFEEMDSRIVGALEALRKEFDQRLSAEGQRLEQMLASAPVEPAAAPPSAQSPGFDAIEELKLAAVDIDHSRTQADVLEALLRGAARFSSRAAVFLNREGSMQGWAGTGFGDNDQAVSGLDFDTPPEPWDQTMTGRGGIALNASDCAVLSKELGVSDAEVGVLLPFILGDQVSAIVYADRTGAGDPFDISALQILTFMAAQTLETLPIRSRDATATLQLAAVEAAAPEPISVPEPEPEPELQEAETAHVEQEPESEAADSLEDQGLTAEPEPAWSQPSTLHVPDDLDAAPEPTGPAPALETTEIQPSDFFALPETETETAAGMESAAEPSQPAAEVASEPGMVEPAPTPIAPHDDEATSPGILAAEATTGAAPEAAGFGSTQIVPPTDVDGPGWAFTTTKIPTSAGAEALHEEARRLARLLVTEIKLYNEEQVEEGRRVGDVYSRLRDDIDRSRQIYDDRIESSIRDEKDYFKEALVRILAGGDGNILGI